MKVQRVFPALLVYFKSNSNIYPVSALSDVDSNFPERTVLSSFNSAYGKAVSFQNHI